MRALALVFLTAALAVPSFGQAADQQAKQADQPAAAPQQPAQPSQGTPETPATPPVATPDAAAPSASTNAAPTTAAVANSSQIVVPAETAIPLILDSTVNSRTAYVGQSIYCETIFPITVGNRMVIPVGSSIKGAVTQVIRPGRVKGRAQIGLRFDQLILPNGTTRSLRATLSGFGTTGKEDFNQKEGKIKGQGSKGKDAETIARTTVPGAEIGTIVGAAKGSVGKGLGIGAASGAAAGLIWILATRGEEVVLPRGTNLELQLSAPVNFDRDEIEPPTRYDQGPALPRREYGPHS